MERELSRFRAQSEDGGVFVVVKYETVVEFSPSAGARRGLGGSWRWALDDGRDVSPVQGDPEAFKIVDTDQIIRKVG